MMEVCGIPVTSARVTVTRYDIEIPLSVFVADNYEDRRTLRSAARDTLIKEGGRIAPFNFHHGPLRASFTDTGFHRVQIAVAKMVARVAELQAEWGEAA